MNSDGSDVTFTAWADGEPNNAGIGGFGEDCVMIVGADNLKWNDESCIKDYAAHALCEVNPSM